MPLVVLADFRDHVLIIATIFLIFQSVVSGSSEPDLIRVKRTWDNQLSILSEEVGSKKTQITLMGQWSLGVDLLSKIMLMSPG